MLNNYIGNSWTSSSYKHTSNGTMVETKNVYFSWVARQYKYSTNILN
jgi:hypothetical protein